MGLPVQIVYNITFTVVLLSDVLKTIALYFLCVSFFFSLQRQKQIKFVQVYSCRTCVCFWCCTFCICTKSLEKQRHLKQETIMNYFWTEPRDNDVNGSFTYIFTLSLIGYIDGCHGYQITCTIKNTIPQKSTPISPPSNYLQIPSLSVSICFCVCRMFIKQYTGV